MSVRTSLQHKSCDSGWFGAQKCFQTARTIFTKEEEEEEAL